MTPRLLAPEQSKANRIALLPSKHYSSYRFDVCSTIDCQVYQGTNLSSALTDQAVEETWSA